MSKEKNIEPYLREKLKEIGGRAIKMDSIYEAGLPDRLCLIPEGKVFFAETKSRGKTPSKIQIYQHRRLEEMGFRVEVIDSIARVKEILSDYQ